MVDSNNPIDGQVEYPKSVDPELVVNPADEEKLNLYGDQD